MKELVGLIGEVRNLEFLSVIDLRDPVDGTGAGFGPAGGGQGGW